MVNPPIGIGQFIWFQVADWLLEICEDQSAQPEVFCLAMNYLDRFLGSVRIGQSQLQLLGAVCLLVAWKVRQHEPLPAARLVEYSDYNLNLIDIMVSINDNVTDDCFNSRSGSIKKEEENIEHVLARRLSGPG